MRVLFVHRRGVFGSRGGERDQLVNTRAALAELGVETDLADSVPDDYSRYDLVHFFGLDICHIPGIEEAKSIPKVMTPVFWDKAQGNMLSSEYEDWPRPGRELRDRIAYWYRRRTGKRDRRVGRICRSHFHDALARFGQFQEVINDIDLFLPNSEAEMGALTTFYVFDEPRYCVIPNAVDITAVDHPSDFADRCLPKSDSIVCCSGGIDRRKNQYSLVKAMLDIDVPLVLAGDTRDAVYLESVRRVAARRRDVFFLGHLDQPDLHSVYRAAAVHALPSFHDTPGISNLEAVAHECVNVGTQIGGLREYLGGCSLYCNPFSATHIRTQILKALSLPPNKEGAELVRKKYTYERVAEETVAAYRAVLGESL